MPKLADKDTCTGCTACYAVCPVTAIHMVPDGMGFKHPVIDSAKCIECKKCERTCPVLEETNGNCDTLPLSYAGALMDKESLAKSQSRGAFFAVASKLAEEGYIVCGAAFDSNLRVNHQFADSVEDLDKFRGSKYVQSDLRNCFKELISLLKVGKRVLFSGTPCQVAGLKRAVPQKYADNLTTVDIICHGVPAPEVYHKYIEYLENKHRSKITTFNFRDKEACGWRTARESAIFENGEKIISYSYNYLFQVKEVIIRQSCGNCHFCNLNRPGDITIADCWGWEKLGRTDFIADKGISLLLANTDKGKTIVESTRDRMHVIEVPLEPLMQKNLKMSTTLPNCAVQVRQDFIRHGYRYIHKKYGDTRLNHVKIFIGRAVRKINKEIKKAFG